jgi:hypothetical protein
MKNFICIKTDNKSAGAKKKKEIIGQTALNPQIGED